MTTKPAIHHASSTPEGYTMTAAEWDKLRLELFRGKNSSTNSVVPYQYFDGSHPAGSDKLQNAELSALLDIDLLHYPLVCALTRHRLGIEPVVGRFNTSLDLPLFVSATDFLAVPPPICGRKFAIAFSDTICMLKLDGGMPSPDACHLLCDEQIEQSTLEAYCQYMLTMMQHVGSDGVECDTIRHTLMRIFLHARPDIN